MNYFDVLFAKKQSGGGGTPTLITKTITENGTYNASEDNADGYSQVTVNVPYMEKKSASGDIASFSDGAGYPFLKVKANITPVQDLHGYDYPWVGGAGYNKWDEEWELGDINYVTGENIDNDQLIRSKNYISIVGGQTYYATVSSLDSTNNLRARFYDANKTYIGSTQKDGNLVYCNSAFTAPDNASYMRFATQISYGTTYKHDIAINYPSTVTTYSPYSNICPISGFTGVNVPVTGVNVWDEELESGDIDTTTGQNSGTATNMKRSATYARVDSTKPFYFYSSDYQNINFRMFFYDSNFKYLGYKTVQTNSVIHIEDHSNFFADASYIKFRIAAAIIEGEKYSINYPSTDTSYHAYNGHVYPISWQDEAGIVYGGYIDLVSGVLTKMLEGVDLGTLAWSYNSAQTRFYVQLPLAKFPTNADIEANILCEEYKTESFRNVQAGSLDGVVGGVTTTDPYVTIRDTRYSDATLFTNAMSGVKLVYELATPQTYQLTPQQINTLIRQNNAWNNTNGQTEVEYFIPIE